MKKITVMTSAVALLLISSCNNNSKDQNEIVTMQDSSVSTPQSPITENQGVKALATLDGQYPIEVNLLDNPSIKNRLETLLGIDYRDFRKFWNVETPIIIEDSILSTSGCEEHNCGANQFVMQIDLKNDNINVYHFGKEVKMYKENGVIKLPSGLAKDFETLKSNMVY